MSKELELWRFVSDRLRRVEKLTLLVVAESSGSSPGRAGYKMAVASDGELCGSIGGGVMEVSLVELAKEKAKEAKGNTEIREQVHQKNSPNASGMICSGKQTVIFKKLDVEDLGTIDAVLDALKTRRRDMLVISNSRFDVTPTDTETPDGFDRRGDEFVYKELLGMANELYVIGGGHCALALSELMSKLDFHVSIFDDRPELNTIDKNIFAEAITIIDSYDSVARHIPKGDSVYVAVMTLGYASDAVVIRQLMDRDFRYFGVLGSKAKMATLLKELKGEGHAEEKLKRIRTPIGLTINSRTPEEIAISIAAEIIAVKNA